MASMVVDPALDVILNEAGRARIKNYFSEKIFEIVNSIKSDPEFKYSGIDIDSMTVELWSVNPMHLISLGKERDHIGYFEIGYDKELDKYLVQAALVLTFKYDYTNPVYHTIVGNFKHYPISDRVVICSDSTGEYFRKEVVTSKTYKDGPRICLCSFVQVVLDNTDVDKIDF